MFQLIDPSDVETSDDKFSYLTGARPVGPDEWQAGLPGERRYRLSYDTYAEALALAADQNGLILDFRPNEFYERDVTKVLACSGDPKRWRVRYDRFVAMVLIDLSSEFISAGFLAHRGNGHSSDHRLMLPARS
jgi:hypothetical protein